MVKLYKPILEEILSMSIEILTKTHSSKGNKSKEVG